MQHVKHSPVFFAALLAVTTVVHADNADQLEVIRAAYADQVGSIDSISVKLEIHTVTTISGKSDERIETREVIHWAREGTRRKADVERESIEPEIGKRREWYSFDGRDRTAGDWIRETGELHLRVSSGLTRKFFWMLQPDDFLFLRLPNTKGVALSEMLERPSARVAGLEEVQGIDCWKVVLGSSEEVGPYANQRFIAWFDPTVNFLPRKLVAESHDGNDTVIWRREVLISQFARVSDPTRNERWFPESVTWRQTGSLSAGDIETRKQVKLVGVKVNDEIDGEEFELKTPPGTAVSDHRQPGMPNNYVVGNAAEITRIAENQQELIRESAAAIGSKTLDASPTRTSWFWWFLGASVTCVLTAAVVRWRRSRV